MRRLVLILGILLLATLLWANPFLGRWKVGDDRYMISETHISGVMDGQPYETDYTYTQRAWTWRDRTWLYYEVNPNTIFLIAILTDGQGGVGIARWVLVRDTPDSGGT